MPNNTPPAVPKTNAIKPRMIILIMEDVEFPKHTAIILDDFHLIKNTEINLFLKTIITCQYKELHIIIITRDTTNLELAELFSKNLVYIFPQKHLAFTQSEVKKFCSLQKLKLPEEQINEIYALTGGWVSLVYLLIKGAEQGLKIRRNSEINNLIETVLYNVYDENIKRFLLRLSVMDNFTQRQAQFVTEESCATDILKRLSHENAFVVYDEEHGKYKIHSIMLDFLRSKLTDEEEKKALYRKLGKWYLSEQNYASAYVNLFLGGDSEIIFQSLEKDNTTEFDNFGFYMADELFSGTQKELLYKYPIAYLQYIGYLLRCGNPQKAKNGYELLEEIFAYFSNEKEINLQYKNLILAEISINRVFADFNNIEMMKIHTAEAARLLNGEQSKTVSKNGEYTFGCPNFLYTYYQQTGKLKWTADFLSKEFPVFTAIANGIGTGNNYLAQAEFAVETGDYDTAELNAFKAIYKAKAKNQNTITINAAFVLLRLYIYQGKVTLTHEIMKQIRDDTACENNALRNMTLDIISGYINAVLAKPDNIPKWLRQGTMSAACFMYEGLYFNYIVYAKAVLLSKNYIQLEMLTETLPQYFSVFNNRIGLIHTRILRAISKHYLYCKDEGIKELKLLLDETKSDNIILIYAEYAPQITAIIKAVCEQEKDCYFIEILNACLKYNESLKYFNKERISLSKRELELLKLAREGYTRREIAEKIFLSPGTVQTHLHNIYLKLEANGRTEAIRKAEQFKLI